MGAGHAIASLVALQLFSKAVNFALNVMVIRATGTRLFGVSAVPLALLLSTIQFLSREGVRGACQRVKRNIPLLVPVNRELSRLNGRILCLLERGYSDAELPVMLTQSEPAEWCRNQTNIPQSGRD